MLLDEKIHEREKTIEMIENKETQAEKDYRIRQHLVQKHIIPKRYDLGSMRTIPDGYEPGPMEVIVEQKRIPAREEPNRCTPDYLDEHIDITMTPLYRYLAGSES